ncbi:hypothetical protein EDD85DRAFT_931969 [Armillaria nabsnona]|nr:hypothetical protein EDD85DRAFT_931969 [Armillaria nabsnona]
MASTLASAHVGYILSMDQTPSEIPVPTDRSHTYSHVHNKAVLVSVLIFLSNDLSRSLSQQWIPTMSTPPCLQTFEWPEARHRHLRDSQTLRCMIQKKVTVTNPYKTSSDTMEVDFMEIKETPETHHALALVKLVLTNSEFRKLIKNFSVPGVNGQPDTIDPGMVKRSVDAEVNMGIEKGKKASGITVKVKNKDCGNDKLSYSKHFLIEDYFERQEQWILRTNKVVVEYRKHNDYQESLG